jgi:predicted CxxxxCH...CXXCH cytochrome family protein
MHVSRIASLALVAGALHLAACDSARSTADAKAGGTCTGCHGETDNDTGAPPKDAHGQTTGPQVGAHTRHLMAGVACESCHRVPASPNDPGHIGGDKVLFGAAARQDGAAPTFVANADPSSQAGGTCNSTYCHGATLNAGGSLHAPTWNGPRAVCGDCHGIPPPSHGTGAGAALRCDQCHPETVEPGLIIKQGGKHMDGTVQVDLVAACTSCHGDASRVTAVPLDKAAPPVDASGQTAGAKVGAHQAHLVDGPLAKAVACAECHTVPFGVAHATEANAVVVFNGPVGTKGGATPTYANGKCSGVYCHGAGTTPLPGGTLQAPSWAGGPDQAACGTCHAFVPPAPHPQLDRSDVQITVPAQCSQCHPGTVNANGTLFVQNGLHVNGVVDGAVHDEGWLAAPGALQPHGLAANRHDPVWPSGIDSCRKCHGADLNGEGTAVSCNACHAANGKPGWQTDCTFCHGEPNRTAFPAAPPVDTLGHTAATDRGVGAHQTHLLGRQPSGAISDGVACADCHEGQPYTGIAHVDGIRAVALKRPGTATVAGAFDDAAGTCASTYCHGNFRNGKASNAPSWTATGGQGACDTCHAPQTGSLASGYSDRHKLHLALAPGLACATCHVGGYSSAATPPTVNKATHVNGAVDMNTQVGWSPTAHTCTIACHTAPQSPPWY